MRVQRDIARLPLRYFPSASDDGGIRRTTLLPDREPYIMVRGTAAAQEESLLTADGHTVVLPPDLRKIDSDVSRRASRGGTGTGECVVFGGYRMEGERFVLSKPEDPMAELVLLRGEPGSHLRQKRPHGGPLRHGLSSLHHSQYRDQHPTHVLPAVVSHPLKPLTALKMRIRLLALENFRP